MTPLRLDQIKKAAADTRYEEEGPVCLDLLGMLQEVILELERVRSIPQTGGRGHLKPVILDAKGEAIAPPPISDQLALERRIQYALDRYDACMELTVEAWRVFSLRWGLTPPPGGWANETLIINTIHAVRIGLDDIPYIDKHKSAMHLTANGIRLPPGVYIKDGVLHGVKSPPGNIQ